jgi:hypothetical protein
MRIPGRRVRAKTHCRSVTTMSHRLYPQSSHAFADILDPSPVFFYETAIQ